MAPDKTGQVESKCSTVYVLNDTVDRLVCGVFSELARAQSAALADAGEHAPGPVALRWDPVRFDPHGPVLRQWHGRQAGDGPDVSPPWVIEEWIIDHPDGDR
jgi:hypothetical protein